MGEVHQSSFPLDIEYAPLYRYVFQIMAQRMYAKVLCILLEFENANLLSLVNALDFLLMFFCTLSLIYGFWGILDKEYWEYRMEWHTSQGVDPRRANQRFFEEWHHKKSKFFISYLWFDLVDFITGPDGMLETQHKDYRWLWDFMPPPISGGPVGESPTKFQNARKEFDLHPRTFIERLEAFAKDLVIQELSYAMIEYLSDPKNAYDRLKCWINLQSRISKIMEDTQHAASRSEFFFPRKHTNLDWAYDFLKSRRESHGPDIEAADLASKFLERYIANGRPYEDKSEFLNPIVVLSKTYMLSTFFKAAYTLTLERLRRLQDVLDKLNENKLNKSMYKMLRPTSTTLEQISDHLKDLTESELSFSAVYHQFQLNVCEFLATITGEDKIDYKSAFKTLQDATANRQEQWETLYKTIEKLRLELAQKQQAITCLGYRHFLEMLPDKRSLQNLFPTASLTEATPIWKLTWQVIVEKELFVMLQDHVNILRPGTFAATAPKPKPTDSNWHLRLLLENSFQYWTKTNRKLINTAITNNTITAVTQIASGAAPTTRAFTNPKFRTNFTDLLDSLKLEYWTWQGYQRGLGLYNELSNTIHTYGKRFEVDETNWGKSDWLVLKYLTPNAKSIVDGEVDWDIARTDRKLP